jgi:alternate signal-mediated exported protein
MNKLIKGSIAGAAGIALFLGGAGTLATWNSSANVLSSPTQITAGTLSIAAASPVAAGDGWKVNTTAVTPTQLAAFKIIPGDTVTYTSTFDVIATGNNVSAKVELGAAAITPADPAKAADVALATKLGSGVSFTVNGASASTVTITPATTTVVVTVTLPYGSALAVTDNLSKLGVVNLSGFTVTLTQN